MNLSTWTPAVHIGLTLPPDLHAAYVGAVGLATGAGHCLFWLRSMNCMRGAAGGNILKNMLAIDHAVQEPARVAIRAVTQEFTEGRIARGLGAIRLGDLESINAHEMSLALSLQVVERLRHGALASAELHDAAPRDWRSFADIASALDLAKVVKHRLLIAEHFDFDGLPNVTALVAEIQAEAAVAARARGQERPPVQASADFREVRWGAITFRFSTSQARAVQVLFTAREEGHSVHKATWQTNAEFESPPNRLFQGHPAWNTMIVHDGKGHFWLADPPGV